MWGLSVGCRAASNQLAVLHTLLGLELVMPVTVSHPSGHTTCVEAVGAVLLSLQCQCIHCALAGSHTGLARAHAVMLDANCAATQPPLAT